MLRPLDGAVVTGNHFGDQVPFEPPVGGPQVLIGACLAGCRIVHTDSSFLRIGGSGNLGVFLFYICYSAMALLC